MGLIVTTLWFSSIHPHSLTLYSLIAFIWLYLPSTSFIHSLAKKKRDMEACCLTSNSFCKTLELAIPLTKSRNLKTNFNHFLCRRASFPSSITCCHLESSLPSDDDKKPFVDADWRSFRARLVAAEQTLRPQVPSNSTSSVEDIDIDPDTVVDHQPPQITIGDKWAHSIHQPEKGCLLIATEKLDGVHIFERTVILLLSTGPLGPSGIILNRPSLMSIKEMRSTVLDAATTGTFSDRPLFFGGPLEEGLFLVSPKWAQDGDGLGKSGVLLGEVMKGLYYGTKDSVGCAGEMVKRNVVGVDEFRFFDGYCGWEKEQLNEEIRAGYWTLAACSPTVIGLNNVGNVGLWEEIICLMGPRKVW